MKKFFKTLVGIGATAAIAGGIYYVYKNYIKDDKFDEDDDEDYDDFDEGFSKDRSYVKIDIEGGDDETPTEVSSDEVETAPVDEHTQE